MNVFNTQANIFKVNGGLADIFANRPAPTGSYYIFWSTDTGEIFYDDGTWIQFGGGGNFIIDTYANIASLKNSGQLIPGAIYCINNPAAPLHSIYITALTNNTFTSTGYSLQYCPAYYGSGNFNGWFWNGVWRSSLTPNINSLCVWGAKVWRNRNGNVGSALDNFTLDNTEWQLIGNEIGRYILKPFSIEFNFNLNFVSKQSDDKGNIVTGRNAQFTNGCVLSDWNQPNVRNNNVQIYFLNNLDYIENNICQTIQQNDNGVENNFCKRIEYNTNFVGYNTLGFEHDIAYNIGTVRYNTNAGNIEFNTVGNEISYNSNAGKIAFNIVAFFITGNSNKGNINTNTVNSIIANSNGSEISNNTFTGNIEYNKNAGFINNNGGNMSGIFSNFCGGSIFENNNSAIGYNKNTGNIYQNSLNTFGIFKNTNNGDINLNSCPCQINQNSNNGNITNNGANITLIEHNGNGGNIQDNNNTGTIQHNFNAGNVSNNTNAGSITNNTNGGAISANSNAGNISTNSNGSAITGNSNGGQIFQNSNAAGIQNNSNTSQIYRNQNNGQITGITNVTAQIFSNINNGNISTSIPGNITDPVVNK